MDRGFAMNVPGFTAESSLTKASKSYYTMGSDHAAGVLPQALAARKGGAGILDALECLAWCFCCASSLDPYCCINCYICTELLVNKGPVIIA
jgi:hypothetical protein